jgi:acyl carrier protein
MTDQKTLLAELVQKISETLNLEQLRNASIDGQTPIVGGDLGIDSIDILELVMMLERDYGIVVDDKELGKKVFRTFGTLVDFVAERRR